LLLKTSFSLPLCGGLFLHSGSLVGFHPFLVSASFYFGLDQGMQIGFLVFETGSVRRENQKHIILKNVLDNCVAFSGFTAIGYSVAFGGDCDAFSGGFSIMTSQFSSHSFQQVDFFFNSSSRFCFHFFGCI